MSVITGPQLIAELRKGQCGEDIQLAMNEAVKRTKITGKSSKVTITLTIEPADVKAGDITTVFIDDEVKATLPRLSQRQTMFFIDAENDTLSRNDPQQFIQNVVNPSKS